MRFGIINAAGDVIWSFTVCGADWPWVVRNAAHLHNLIKLYKGADMVFAPLADEKIALSV